MRDRTVFAYKDEAVWKSRLAVADENRAYVILLDKESRVLWMNSTAFSDSEFARLKDAAR